MRWTIVTWCLRLAAWAAPESLEGKYVRKRVKDTLEYLDPPCTACADDVLTPKQIRARAGAKGA
jgi:hypothetical protein